MSLSKTYTAYYAETSGNLPFYKKALTERPNRAVILAAEKGGEHAVQAMFDAIIDSGDRHVLVQALNSPSLPEWVRERLQTLLYGSNRQRICALLQPMLH